jgi:hypothetical protein
VLSTTGDKTVADEKFVVTVAAMKYQVRRRWQH